MVSRIPDIEELINEAKNTFKEEFNYDPTIIACAPGRVNLIGEHTDYNDGFVLPMALPLYTVIVGKLNNSKKITIITSELIDKEENKAQFDVPSVNNPLKPGNPHWANYVRGVVVNFPGTVAGFDAAFTTSVPLGGGVSSSASLEVAAFTFLEALTNTTIDQKVKALSCQKAEHQFAGMPCGIMDQFISTMGKKDNALLIDCRSLVAELIPLKSNEVVILVTNSNVKHKLTGSEYPQRRAQCEEASNILGKLSLRDANEEDIKELERLKTNPLVIQRAKHVIHEISRTQKAADALLKENYAEMGRLMYDSHASLRDLFEVSCIELDILVAIAMDVKGVLGSRMTGGGFGGCTVTLVNKIAVDDVIKAINEKYTGKPTFYVCRPGDGAKILS